MKKMFTTLVMASGLMFAGCQAGFCDALTDQLNVALLQHFETIVETTNRGVTNTEMLITPVQFGHISGSYLAGLDGGVLGNVAPSSLGQSGFNWTAGVHFHLTPLLKQFLPTIAPNYPALTAIEINPRVSYVFASKANNVSAGWQIGLGVGWAFGLTPLP